MKVTSLEEETNEDNIFSLVIGGRVEAYVARVEQHMVRGVNGPSCRSKILGPAAGSVRVHDVVSEWRIYLSKTRTMD